MKEISQNRIFNILLFGETGAGKSTTINALANYWRFGTFQEAQSAQQFVHIVPSHFTLWNVETDEPFEVREGEDGNENHNEEGHSVTQAPREYTFVHGHDELHIIDTPGLSDTRGLEVDKRNFNKILDFLLERQFNSLHAICFIIKSNTTRETATFRNCIGELLFNLHQDACKNLIFCFTHSRNSLFKPGDGFATVKQYLTENVHLNRARIELKTGKNCFFIDNETYRFLLAQKHGYKFDSDQMDSFKESWQKSAQQTNALIGRVLSELKEHKLRDMFTLISARKWLPIATELMKNEEMHKKNLHKVEKFTCQAAIYLLVHSNSPPESLILPYLDLLKEYHPTNLFDQSDQNAYLLDLSTKHENIKANSILGKLGDIGEEYADLFGLTIKSSIVNNNLPLFDKRKRSSMSFENLEEKRFRNAEIFKQPYGQEVDLKEKNRKNFSRQAESSTSNDHIVNIENVLNDQSLPNYSETVNASRSELIATHDYFVNPNRPNRFPVNPLIDTVNDNSVSIQLEPSSTQQGIYNSATKSYTNMFASESSTARTCHNVFQSQPISHFNLNSANSSTLFQRNFSRRHNRKPPNEDRVNIVNVWPDNIDNENLCNRCKQCCSNYCNFCVLLIRFLCGQRYSNQQCHCRPQRNEML